MIRCYKSIMPITQQILLYMPSWMIVVVLTASFVAISICGLTLVRRFIPIHKLKVHNDVAGFIFATIGVIYAVMLAFMVMVSWQNFEGATKIVEKEASCLAAIYRDSQPLGNNFKLEVRSAIKDYIGSIIKDEWKTLTRGEQSEKTQVFSNKIWNLYGSYTPKTDIQKIFFAESVRKMNEVGELRRMRIIESQAGIPSVLWVILFSGALITISFTFFFGTENFGAQLLMTSILAALIALILFAIMSLDFPFTGDQTISPKPMKFILKHFSAY